MNKFIDFLLQRRSVTPKIMLEGNINKEDLQLILKAGLRIPDHGSLKPWKIIVISNDRRKFFDEEILLKEYKKNNPDASEDKLKIESSRMQRANTVIVVLFTPRFHPKIPEWEQVLSTGAVCTTILYAAQSLNYAAAWITEWYSYNIEVIEKLGGDPSKDKVAGFIYLGERLREPIERRRPDPEEYINYF